MVAQVKPTFSQNRRGGTAKWTTASVGSSSPPRVRSMSGSAQSAHAVTVRASTARSAGIASASQAQLAQYRRPPVSTGYGVGTAENGCAIQMFNDHRSERERVIGREALKRSLDGVIGGVDRRRDRSECGRPAGRHKVTVDLEADNPVQLGPSVRTHEISLCTTRMARYRTTFQQLRCALERTRGACPEGQGRASARRVNVMLAAVGLAGGRAITSTPRPHRWPRAHRYDRSVFAIGNASPAPNATGSPVSR